MKAGAAPDLVASRTGERMRGWNWLAFEGGAEAKAALAPLTAETGAGPAPPARRA
jgi:hypothetical protein